MPQAPHRDTIDPLGAARAFAESGRFKKARGAYKRALKLSPRHPEILSELGSMEAQCGNLEGARHLMRRAIALSPAIATFHFNLGELERQAERYAEAEASYREALRLEPNDSDALFGLGTSLLLQKNAADAVDVLQRAHRLSSRDTEILNELGNALGALGRNDEAVGAYRQALTLRPDYFDCWLNLALCHFDRERFFEANEVFDRAAAIDAIPETFLWKRAQVQTQCGHYDLALATAEASIAADPASHHGWLVRGIIAQYEGRFDDCERDLRRALELKPSFVEAYEHLSVIKRLSIRDAGRIEEILAETDDLADTARVSAGFTLYRLYDAAGDRANAFRALAEANRLKRQVNPFDQAGHIETLRQIAEVFSAAFLRDRAGEGIAADTPIFILGMPRSGTTLAEQILAGSPDVCAGGEQMVLHRLAGAISGFPQCLRDVDAGWAAVQARKVLEQLTSRSADHRFVTDKTPGNYRHIGLIAWLFPNARIIYCRRDPMDIGFSCFEQNFHSGLNYGNDFADFAVAWRAHQEIMAHWQAVLPGRIFVVDYEQLVREPVERGRQIFAFCGLEWDDAYVDTTKVDRPIQTASVWQARQPINISSIGKWRRYESHLSSLADAVRLS